MHSWIVAEGDEANMVAPFGWSQQINHIPDVVLEVVIVDWADTSWLIHHKHNISCTSICEKGSYQWNNTIYSISSMIVYKT